MRDLLREQFFQLRRNIGFLIVWICALAAAFLNDLYNGAMFVEMPGHLDDAAFGTLPSLGIFCAFTVSAILASDYTEGSVRVRAMAGYSRAHVYLASLAGACVQCMLLAAAALLGDITAMPFLGPFQMGVDEYFTIVLITVLCSCVYAALYTVITMLMCNRSRGTSAAVVVCGLLAFALIISCGMIDSALSEPELTEGWDVAPDGSVYEVGAMPNPAYVSGTARAVLECLQCALPSGQLNLAASGSLPGNVAPMLLWSVVAAASYTAVGIFVFRRKDLQ